MLSFAQVVGIPLALALSALLLWRYRRATEKGMQESAVDPSTLPHDEGSSERAASASEAMDGLAVRSPLVVAHLPASPSHESAAVHHSHSPHACTIGKQVKAWSASVQ